MEIEEVERIKSLSASNPELRHLWQQHSNYEAQLSELERVRHPSEGERREISRLKRLKLRGKDQITRILDASR